MARKKLPKITDLKQLDVISAMRGQTVFLEEKENDVKTKDAVTPFTFINDIRKYKHGNLLDKEENLSIFNSYMILRGLSMKESDALICNFFNQYCNILSKKQMYLALISIVPKDMVGFYPWIKNESIDNLDQVKFITKYFECSEKEAKEFINICGIEWANKIKEKFGDFI